MAEALDRRSLAERCVDLHLEHADLFRDIDDVKEQLRKFAEASVEGIDDLRATLRKLLRDDGLGVDDLKAELRKLGAPGHDGFVEEFAGKGLVKVSGGSVEKFKGIMPVLDPAAFLELPDKQRDKLTGDKIVTMQRQFTEARRPSVTVKL
jgi:hypothetical protein